MISLPLDARVLTGRKNRSGYHLLGDDRPCSMQTHSTDHQTLLDAYFDAQSLSWSEIYTRSDDVHSVIHQHRLGLAVEWIESLSLREGSQVLDVGCGTGPLAVLLAKAGLCVTATDTVPAMLEATRRRAAQADVDGSLNLRLEDAHALDLPTGAFDLVIGLGVLGWLDRPAIAAGEMARTLKPGGHLIANVDNLVRLTRLADPIRNPLFHRPRLALVALLERAGLMAKQARPMQYRPRKFDHLVERSGLDIVRRGSFGFGPFTFCGRDLLSQSTGVRLHRSLQRLADRGTPILRSSGAQYIVMARKPAAASE
jgi:2-polyprenyl-3-methyl-5-hydroxy-6-metoxy-1,4-benzoquinol methylase